MVVEKIENIRHTSLRVANDPKVRKANISYIIGFSHIVKTMQLIMYLLCGSFFMGIFWHLFCKLTKDMAVNNNGYEVNGGENFIDVFGLNELD